MSKLSDLIAQVEKTDAELAKELRKEVKELSKRRPFGLNFERHQPENVRLYGRKARKGDKINILPERGQAEKAENKEIWSVVDVVDGNAKLEIVQDDEVLTAEANVEDLVVLSEFNKPIFPGLKETGRVERGEDRPYQVVVNSENYHALEMLLYAYEGKVDCIYIDPPYNTGARDWKYNNDYVDSSDQYRHSKWLAMMEKRLKLAKRLMNPSNSALIVTIDEKEHLRLGLLLEQIFSSARIQMTSIIINPSGAKRDKLFSRSDEYAFFVMIGDAQVIHPRGDGEIREVRWWYLRRTDYSSRRGTVKGGTAQFYPIYVNTKTNTIEHIGEPLPHDVSRDSVPKITGTVPVFPVRDDGVEMNWGLTGPSLAALLKKGVVRVTKSDNENQPYVFRYLSENFEEKVSKGRWSIQGKRDDGTLIVVEAEGKVTRATTVLQNKSYDAGQYGTSLVRALLGAERSFPFPKSLYAVEDTLNFVVAENPHALVIDYFAGSGSTTHAVMRLNHRDGGKRKCISVTNNEVGADEAKSFMKAGLRQGDLEWEQKGICEYITKPRVTAAITGRMPEGKPIKGEYKFVDEFPMADGFEENAIFYDLTYEDEMMVELDMAFERIAPILWLKAGQEGRCIDKRKSDFDIADTYAVLFDYKYSQSFMDALQKADKDKLRIAYIVTDQDSRFQDVAQQLPQGIEPVRLYESYLRTFKINQSEG